MVDKLVPACVAQPRSCDGETARNCIGQSVRDFLGLFGSRDALIEVSQDAHGDFRFGIAPQNSRKRSAIGQMILPIGSIPMARVHMGATPRNANANEPDSACDPGNQSSRGQFAASVRVHIAPARFRPKNGLPPVNVVKTCASWCIANKNAVFTVSFRYG